jgi:acyl-CoA synthetase (AMP-forming)/AMP-acid ligase II
MKVIDVPDMKYFAHDGCGEVCIKGANVFDGYYKDPEETVEVLDEDGWLHTGDIGLWTESGTLKLIDRKKHIFKLAQVWLHLPCLCVIFPGESLFQMGSQAGKLFEVFEKAF